MGVKPRSAARGGVRPLGRSAEREKSPLGQSAEREKLEARAGFEPANDGFANRCLSQLGDRAVRQMVSQPGRGLLLTGA